MDRQILVIWPLFSVLCHLTPETWPLKPRAGRTILRRYKVRLCNGHQHYITKDRLDGSENARWFTQSFSEQAKWGHAVLSGNLHPLRCLYRGLPCVCIHGAGQVYCRLPGRDCAPALQKVFQGPGEILAVGWRGQGIDRDGRRRAVRCGLFLHRLPALHGVLPLRHRHPDDHVDCQAASHRRQRRTGNIINAGWHFGWKGQITGSFQRRLSGGYQETRGGSRWQVETGSRGEGHLGG